MLTVTKLPTGDFQINLSDALVKTDVAERIEAAFASVIDTGKYFDFSNPVAPQNAIRTTQSRPVRRRKAVHTA